MSLGFPPGETAVKTNCKLGVTICNLEDGYSAEYVGRSAFRIRTKDGFCKHGYEPSTSIKKGWLT